MLWGVGGDGGNGGLVAGYWEAGGTVEISLRFQNHWSFQNSFGVQIARFGVTCFALEQAVPTL